MRKFQGVSILLTAVLAVSLLLPAAMAAPSSKQQKMEETYTFQTDTPEDSSKISKELTELVRKAARRTGKNETEVAVATKDDAEYYLGIELASGDTFDAMDKIVDGKHEDRLSVSFRPSLKIERTVYERIRKSGDTTVTLRISTLWEKDASVSAQLKPDGMQVTERSCKTSDGKIYKLYQVLDSKGTPVWDYVVFQRGCTNYTLYAQNTAGVPQELLPSVLETMRFPA